MSVASPSPEQRATESRMRRPRLRAVLWVSALLLGGLGLIVLAYSVLSGVDLFYTLAAIALALLGLAYMIAVLLALDRRGEATRVHDRERRGF